MWRKFIWLALATVLAASCVSGARTETKDKGGTQAGELLRTAYLAVVDAELARSEQRDVDAVAAYRRALALYGRLQAEYPGWQAAMVSYRVAECQNELAAAESMKPAEGGTNSVATAVRGTNDTARLQALLQELNDARDAMATDREKNSLAAQKLLEKETERLKDEVNDTVKANQALLRKVARLEAKLNRAGIAEGTNTVARTVVAAVKSEAKRMMQENRNPDAIALLREASDLIPTEPDLLVQLSVAYCRVADFASAVRVLEPFDVKHPSNADALMTLGTASMGLGKIGEARVATEKALKIKPDSPEANYNLAQILISLSPPEVMDAQQHYRRALELGLAPDPDFENTLRTALIIARLKKHSVPGRTTSVEQRTSPPRPIPITGESR